MNKKCKECGEIKSISSFYKHKGMADGHLNICISCKQEYQRNRSRSVQGRLYDHNRNQHKKRREWLHKYQLIRRERNPDKYRCGYLLSNAIRDRRIIRPTECSVCGSKEKIQGHHEDYSKPLEVIWLCSKCHRKLHSQYERKSL